MSQNMFDKYLMSKMMREGGGGDKFDQNLMTSFFDRLFFSKFHTEFLSYSCSDIIQGRKRAINNCKKKEGSFIRNSIVFPVNEI